MEFTITSPAVLFPAISLLFLAYTNRFLHLSALARSLHSDWLMAQDPMLRTQVGNLKKRIRLIRWCQALGVVSLIVCLSSILSLLYGNQGIAVALFTTSVILMLLSLIASLWEILISGGALDVFLNHMESSKPQQNKYARNPKQ
jgi:heme O synthase-like polyprenyltransferase